MLAAALGLALSTTVLPPDPAPRPVAAAHHAQIVRILAQGWRGQQVAPAQPVQPPPPPVVENARPRRGWVWVGGSYQWRGGRYVWFRGHWERERAGWQWSPGRWDWQVNRYVWIPGGWVAAAPPPPPPAPPPPPTYAAPATPPGGVYIETAPPPPVGRFLHLAANHERKPGQIFFHDVIPGAIAHRVDNGRLADAARDDDERNVRSQRFRYAERISRAQGRQLVIGNDDVELAILQS